MPTIREADESDWPRIWALFQQVAVRGDVFAYDENTTEEEARKLWFNLPSVCFVAELESQFAGTYFLRPNQPGRGSHVANGGYMVSPLSRNRGVASAMCADSITIARRMGFTAMQFNFVIATNIAAIRVWEKHGFTVVGRLPRAFQHREHGFVDALVMFRKL